MTNWFGIQNRLTWCVPLKEKGKQFCSFQTHQTVIREWTKVPSRQRKLWFSVHWSWMAFCPFLMVQLELINQTSSLLASTSADLPANRNHIRHHCCICLLISRNHPYQACGICMLCVFCCGTVGAEYLHAKVQIKIYTLYCTVNLLIVHQKQHVIIK